MLTATVGFDGSAQATITATETADGVRFSIALTGTEDYQLAGDIRGLFLDLASNITSSGSDDEAPFNWFGGNLVTGTDVTEVQWGEDSVIDLGNGANMNGEEPSNHPPEGYSNNIFDLGIEIGTSGAGQGDKFTSTEFEVQGITLAELEDQFFGLRLTSTEGTAGSLKLVGKFTDGNTNDDWEGLSPGYWKNWSPEAPGNQVNDWNEDTVIYGDAQYKSFETVFKVEAGDWLISPRNTGTDVTLLQALQLGGDLKGELKKNSLARQATAALLNSLEKDDSDPNGAVNYRFTTEQVLDWTSDALSSEWSSVAGAVASYTDTSSWGTQQETVLGLADLFGSNNNLGLYA